MKIIEKEKKNLESKAIRFILNDLEAFVLKTVSKYLFEDYLIFDLFTQDDFDEKSGTYASYIFTVTSMKNGKKILECTGEMAPNFVYENSEKIKESELPKIIIVSFVLNLSWLLL